MSMSITKNNISVLIIGLILTIFLTINFPPIGLIFIFLLGVVLIFLSILSLKEYKDKKERNIVKPLMTNYYADFFKFLGCFNNDNDNDNNVQFEFDITEILKFVEISENFFFIQNNMPEKYVKNNFIEKIEEYCEKNKKFCLKVREPLKND